AFAPRREHRHPNSPSRLRGSSDPRGTRLAIGVPVQEQTWRRNCRGCRQMTRRAPRKWASATGSEGGASRFAIRSRARRGDTAAMAGIVASGNGRTARWLAWLAMAVLGLAEPAAAQVVHVYEVRHRIAEELAPLVETALAGEGHVVADRRTNALVLSGSP